MKTFILGKQISKAMLGGLLLTSCIAKTSTESDNSTKCLSSSSTPVAKSFEGYWSPKKTSAFDAFLEISKNGEIRFIYDDSWNDNDTTLPKTLGYLQSQSESEATFKASCEFLEYEKQSGKSEAEITKELEDMSKSTARIENGFLVTKNPDSEEVYQRLDSQTAQGIKEKIQQSIEKRQLLLNTQIKPLIGKKIHLSKVTYITIDSNGQSSSFSQEASQISEEYSCGTHEKPKTCYNAKSIEFLNLKESRINEKLKAQNRAYLKNAELQLESDVIAISIKEDEKTSLWLVSGTITMNGNTLTFTSSGKASDGKTYSTIRHFILN